MPGTTRNHPKVTTDWDHPRSRVRGLAVQTLAVLLLTACTGPQADIEASARAELARRPSDYINGGARALVLLQAVG